jgi:hypothetical protein
MQQRARISDARETDTRDINSPMNLADHGRVEEPEFQPNNEKILDSGHWSGHTLT